MVGVRLGADLPLHFQWYHHGDRIGERVALTLGGGDLYVMSEKATGHDWRQSSAVTLRHAAGCDKFLQ